MKTAADPIPWTGRVWRFFDLSNNSHLARPGEAPDALRATHRVKTESSFFPVASTQGLACRRRHVARSHRWAGSSRRDAWKVIANESDDFQKLTGRAPQTYVREHAPRLL